MNLQRFLTIYLKGRTQQCRCTPLVQPIHASTSNPSSSRVDSLSPAVARRKRLAPLQALVTAGLLLGPAGAACHLESSHITLSTDILQASSFLQTSLTDRPSQQRKHLQTLSHEQLSSSQNPPTPLTPLTQVSDSNHHSKNTTSRYVLMGIDCFGMGTHDPCQMIGDNYGLSVGKSISLGWSGKTLIRELKRQYSFAVVNISPTFYANGTAYITIDVVKEAHPDRLSLREPPHETVNVSSNLLELFGEYTNARLTLLRRGVLSSSPTEDLSQEERFIQRRIDDLARHFEDQVPFYRSELIDVATKDKEPSWRRAAAGLLAFDSHNPYSIGALSLALLDAERLVRNEAAQSLTPKLRYAHEVGAPLIDAELAINLLYLPSTADRAAAIGLLNELAHLPSQRYTILKRAFPILKQMLLASRPNANQSALSLLEAATGLNFGRDVDRWHSAIQLH